jgi:hypothetical protein
MSPWFLEMLMSASSGADLRLLQKSFTAYMTGQQTAM